MPIDKTTLDSMLDPFRNMVKDVEARKLTGKAVDEMKEHMATMERLGQEMDDIVSYSTKMATDNVYMNFSNAYSKALSAAASANQPTDDVGLLKQSLAAYEDSYNRLKGDPKNQHLLPPLEQALKIGKSGVSYPVFLRLCEEKGIFAEMASGMPLPSILFDLHCAEVYGYPLEVEMHKKILAGYKALCAKHPFHIADPFEFRLMRQKIEWEYAPGRAKWKAIIERWEKMHDMVADWIDAHCSFAPFDERWVDPLNPANTPINILRTKECTPGDLKVRESIFREYFNLGWDDVWEHETYKAEQAASRIFSSDERVAMIRKTYPVCKLGSTPPADVIVVAERMHKENSYRHPKHLERFGTKEKPGVGYATRPYEDFVKEALAP